ncbi:hypothetical protein PR001_g6772 [Phytophthora rubi]|uniref:Apple domain-containing protein n=3 Tax=Phytophthora TaxID=4783 RepID=A0A6A3NIP8_9STRA|nr:hypothetical protein PR001_g6772 [Phytophthora rubi]
MRINTVLFEKHATGFLVGRPTHGNVAPASGLNAFILQYSRGSYSRKESTMLSAKLLFVCVGLLGAAVSEAATCSTLQQDVEYSGAAVGRVPSSSANGCCSICAKVNGCNAFTWTNDNRGTCWLKSGEGSSKENLGAISGVLKA